jgi:hypothetical protein
MITHIGTIHDGRTVSKCPERAREALTLDPRKADCGACLAADERLVIPGTLADAITGGICPRCSAQCADEYDCQINRELAADGVDPSVWNNPLAV